jgi:transposase
LENAFLKKLNALVQNKEKSPNKTKQAQVVYELRNAFQVKALIQLADILRSTYYYWVKNSSRPDPDAELKVLIKSVFFHEGVFGYRRIRDELRNRGHKVNHKKVQRIMKELGLKCLIRMKKYRLTKKLWVRLH